VLSSVSVEAVGATAPKSKKKLTRGLLGKSKKKKIILVYILKRKKNKRKNKRKNYLSNLKTTQK
jgi:hypothetical protein